MSGRAFSGDGVVEEQDQHQDRSQGDGDDYQRSGHIELLPPRRRLSLFRVALASAVSTAIILGSFTVELPLLTIEPGPVRDVADLVRIEGTQTFSSQGKFLVTTVSLYETTLAGAVRGWFLSDVTVVDRSAVFPPGKSIEEVDRETAAQMDDSQLNATVAALRQLGHELPQNGALVRTIFKETPAEEVLEPGDIVVAVDGTATKNPRDLSDIVNRRQAGDSLMLRINRGDETKEIQIKTIAGEDGTPFIGVELMQSYRFPFKVDIDAGDIGGPSAGLTFALSIIDLLTPEDLTGGKTIADTGQIDADGNIGAIGGIRQKVAAARSRGADVFLVPKTQLDEALDAAGDDLQVIGVSTLAQALEALRRIAG